MSQTYSMMKLAGRAVVSLSLMLAACSTQDVSPQAATPTAGPTGGQVTTPTLRFIVDDPTQTQALFPEEIKEFRVEVTPAGVYRVRFSIAPLEQIPHDASLDRTDADTDEAGIASVTLRAPSIATVFELKAAIGSTSSTSLTIGVQAKGEAELQVVPEYDGKRPIEEWVANAYMSTLCSELPQKVRTEFGLPADSMFNARSVFGIPPRIKQLRVEPFMAVTLRAGHFVFGCANVDQTLTNELNTVRVPVADRPIVLDGVQLELSFGISETTDTWVEHLQRAADDVMLSFTGTSENDPRLVLDTMFGLLDDDDASEFQFQRETQAWDLKVLDSLASTDGLLLRRKLASWLEAGTQTLGVNNALRASVIALADEEVSAELNLLEIAGIDAKAAGFTSPVAATWTADAGDTLALGASLRWLPARLVIALATEQALSEFPEADSLATALGELLDCRALAAAMTSTGGMAEPDYAFTECDQSCAEALCLDALSELGERIGDSDVEQHLQLSATGQASVDAESRLLSLAGSWRGTFPMGLSAAVGGSVTGFRSDEGEQ